MHRSSRDTPPYRPCYSALLQVSDNPPTENNRATVKTGTNDAHQRRVSPNYPSSEGSSQKTKRWWHAYPTVGRAGKERKGRATANFGGVTNTKSVSMTTPILIYREKTSWLGHDFNSDVKVVFSLSPLWEPLSAKGTSHMEPMTSFTQSKIVLKTPKHKGSPILCRSFNCLTKIHFTLLYFLKLL